MTTNEKSETTNQNEKSSETPNTASILLNQCLILFVLYAFYAFEGVIYPERNEQIIPLLSGLELLISVSLGISVIIAVAKVQYPEKGTTTWQQIAVGAGTPILIYAMSFVAFGFYPGEPTMITYQQITDGGLTLNLDATNIASLINIVPGYIGGFMLNAAAEFTEDNDETSVLVMIIGTIATTVLAAAISYLVGGIITGVATFMITLITSFIYLQTRK